MALKLRPYQEEMKRSVYEHWQAGTKNVLLVCPTGGGKTKTFCSIVIDLAINGLFGQKLPTAIKVHRKELVQQISLTLAEEGIVHNIIAPQNVIKGIIASHRRLFKKAFYDYGAPVTVVSVDTINARILRHEKWAKSIKLWITDEAAHVLRENKWGRASSYFPNAIGLGVTATPERLDKRGLGSHVDGVFDVMVQGPTSRWMIENGFLSRYKVAIPQSDYQYYLKAAGDGSDFSAAAMIEASNKSHIVGDVVTNYIKFANGKQAIVFASDIGSGKRMEDEFRSKGITAKLLTGDTPDAERFEALMDYREKKINVLLNVDLFDEGLDVPGIECVIMARPTMSVGKFLQMVGRGLRPAPGKEFLILIDHVGNVDRLGLPDSIRRWSLDRVAKRKRNLNLIRICKNWQCNAPFDRLLHECPYCGHKDEPRKAGEGGGREPLKQVDGDLVLLDPETLRKLEAETHLPSPAEAAAKVAHHGASAAKKAMENQIARINTQAKLAETVALWAGRKRQFYKMTDRQINKYFYMTYDTTIYEILALPKADMDWYIGALEND